ncbi:hypothetical protein HMPREF0673_00875 [Leyella stercorea DSM 18206]|uniref:Uncharacterized protein n=1 Tax=Leyella stercorea DSM 18206 TaxID=1002367 RepID=G6AW77_9BACT|nr:hypothetical protein HMPREF0673_00875 [Leyella stercorea DSM 18206]
MVRYERWCYGEICQHLNTSTPQHHKSQHLNLTTSQHNKSQHLNTSTPQHHNITPVTTRNNKTNQ